MSNTKMIKGSELQLGQIVWGRINEEWVLVDFHDVLYYGTYYPDHDYKIWIRPEPPRNVKNPYLID